MKFLIKIQNGEPIDHPMLIENVLECNPGLDLNNLPENLAWFERKPLPLLGPYEKNQTVKYELQGNTYTDVFYCEQMTNEEKLEKQNKVKEQWKISGLSSWIFNEEACKFLPPVPYPLDGKLYDWDENQQNWVEIIV